MQYLSEGEPPVPGPRAQICVTDYNSDGLLDLIVGDCSNIFTKPELNAAKTKHLNQLIAQQKIMMGEIMELQEQYAKAYKEDPVAAKAAGFEAKLEAHYEKAQPIGTALEEYFGDEPRFASFIWLYTRKPVQ